ncbi:unnamed protein product [Nesidiocoris tenuis]|uniref:Fork-head domain-containing protein n=1 Tax=Nesidiocoris tenuis TaxID=355587 RepID=A0A6H5HXU9_9HEMI|nr:unnamed protein product [Nesidiocoris tenuis]
MCSKDSSPDGRAGPLYPLVDVDQYRLQLYQYAVAAHRLGGGGYPGAVAYPGYHPRLALSLLNARGGLVTGGGLGGGEEPKPQHSYIGLIAMAILSSPEYKLVLSDIYQYILDHYPYFRSRGPGWRNSIRHNLSLNDCFVKAGRSANGKGHYWAIHPANVEDFKKGDFRRRKAQRKVRKHMGLAVEDDGTDSPSPPPLPLSPPAAHHPALAASPWSQHRLQTTTMPRSKKRQFDVASLLAPDPPSAPASDDEDVDVVSSATMTASPENLGPTAGPPPSLSSSMPVWPCASFNQHLMASTRVLTSSKPQGSTWGLQASSGPNTMDTSLVFWRLHSMRQMSWYKLDFRADGRIVTFDFNGCEHRASNCRQLDDQGRTQTNNVPMSLIYLAAFFYLQSKIWAEVLLKELTKTAKCLIDDAQTPSIRRSLGRCRFCRYDKTPTAALGRSRDSTTAFYIQYQCFYFVNFLALLRLTHQFTSSSSSDDENETRNDSRLLVFDERNTSQNRPPLTPSLPGWKFRPPVPGQRILDFQTEKAAHLRSVYTQQLGEIVEKARTSIKDFTDEGTIPLEENIKTPFGARKSLKMIGAGVGSFKPKSRGSPRTNEIAQIGDSGARISSNRTHRSKDKYECEILKLPDIRKPRTISAIHGNS